MADQEKVTLELVLFKVTLLQKQCMPIATVRKPCWMPGEAGSEGKAL